LQGKPRTRMSNGLGLFVQAFVLGASVR
jgi:hypothetical protein